MNYQEFIGEIQQRLDHGEFGVAVRATRAVLTNLGERIDEGEAADLASPLPKEIDYYLESADSGQRFEYTELLDRVGGRIGIEPSDANYYGQQVLALIAEIVPPGNVRTVRDQLPDDFAPLFEFVDIEEAAMRG